MDSSRRSVRTFRAVMGCAVALGAALGAPAPNPSYAGAPDPAWRTVVTGAQGTVSWARATERAGWQNRASDTGPWSFEAWSYPQYPLNCGAQAGVAYQFIWAQQVGDTRDSLLATRGPAVRAEVRRASSVFAASWAHVIDSAAAKLADHTPRVVTSRAANGGCRVAFDRVRVPSDVWRREPYENHDNDGDPATPRRQGLFPWLQAQGYDRPDRRYVVLEQGPGVWNPGGASR